MNLTSAGLERARDAARARAGGMCELGPHAGQEFSHRISKGRVGLASPANGLWTCSWHHQVLIHIDVVLAYNAGWMVYTGHDPATVPVWLDGIYGPDWWLISHDGDITAADVDQASIVVPQPPPIPRPRHWKAAGAHR